MLDMASTPTTHQDLIQTDTLQKQLVLVGLNLMDLSQ